MPTASVNVAIIGAGLSGTTAARTLAAAGFSVCVLEKSRGAGGRMATRRNSEQLHFDHGAQYFTLRDPRFVACGKEWENRGLIALWKGRIVEWTEGGLIDKTNDERYVATPAMNVLCKEMIEDIPLKTEAEVRTLERHEDRWRLISSDQNTLCEADWVISTAPAEQTAAIMPHSSIILEAAAQVKMLPCWAAMVAPEKSLESIPLDGAFINDGPLRWVARNSSKPGRDQARETWVLHAAADWSKLHWEDSRESIAADLWQRWCSMQGIEAGKPAFATAHRWRYALAESVFAGRSLIDPPLRLAACGDWCGGPRVEGAYLSGLEVAERLLQTLSPKVET